MCTIYIYFVIIYHIYIFKHYVIIILYVQITNHKLTTCPRRTRWLEFDLKTFDVRWRLYWRRTIKNHVWITYIYMYICIECIRPYTNAMDLRMVSIKTSEKAYPFQTSNTTNIYIYLTRGRCKTSNGDADFYFTT